MKDISSVDKLEKFMNEVRLLSLCYTPHVLGIEAVSISGTFVRTHGLKRQIVYHVTQYAKYGELFRLIKESECFDEILSRTYFLQLLNGITNSLFFRT